MQLVIGDVIDIHAWLACRARKRAGVRSFVEFAGRQPVPGSMSGIVQR